MQCTFEMFIRGQWHSCCTVEIEDPIAGGAGKAMLDYDTPYAFNEQAPVSLRFPVSLDHKMLPHWPAFLFDLVPQGKGRHYLLGELGIPDGGSADWPLLCAGAFNPIGRIRIKEAVVFYQAHVERQNQNLLNQGFTLEQILQRAEAFIEHLQIHGMLSAGTPGVQGVAPKFLLTKGKDSLWYADGAVRDDQAQQHYLVKLPRGKDLSDLKILRNEAAYMRVAHAMDLFVEDLPDLHGDMLFIPRFDRRVTAAGVERLHQESAASLLGLIGFDARPSQNAVLAALRTCVTDPKRATVEFLKRDVLNLALGNTDNHARNTAVQVVGGEVRLTPLFDFAPMNLDKDGISRTLRWKNSGRVEISNWADVFGTLPIAKTELAEIRIELAEFSRKIDTIEEVMAVQGGDDDIIKARHYSIQMQRDQLRELATFTTGKG
ncbi:MAG: HipA domain-containing protein [Glaciimonas sp.]|nr:HipA domain-containing protein [Glaciimonas sp.]